MNASGDSLVAEQARQSSRPKEPDAEDQGSGRRLSHRGPLDAAVPAVFSW